MCGEVAIGGREVQVEFGKVELFQCDGANEIYVFDLDVYAPE